MVLTLAIAFVSCRRPAASAKNYNVVLITLDTLRADRLGAYGYTRGSTPVLDRLAREGIRFDDATSPAPLTLPAHATMLSGLLPVTHGLRNNGTGVFPVEPPTLATLLKQSGYATGAFVASFVLDRRFGLARGFDVYDDEIDRDPSRKSGIEAERRAERVVDRMIAWMAARRDQFFFAWVHLYDSHAPYAPPEPYASRFRGDLYDGEIAYVDAQIGRIVDALQRSGQRDRTMIVVVGDHGESLGEHGELTHGLLLYQPTLRVPLIIVAPGVLTPGKTIDTPVGSVDLGPTIAALAGSPFPANSKPGLDGRNLSAVLLRGEEPAPAAIYSETLYPTIFGWHGQAAIRQNPYKLIAGARVELFDLKADPHERTSRVDDNRRVFRSLETQLQQIVERKPALTSSPAPLDAETEARLTSLGYVGGVVSTASDKNRRDARDAVALFTRFERATGALNDGLVKDAEGELRRLVAEDPDNPLFRSTLGRALRERGLFDDAIRFYRDAVAASPTDPEAWYNLAVTYQEAGRKREAGIAIREAIRKDTKRPEAHNTLGVALLTEGDVGGARQEFQKAIALDPRNAEALNNLGNLSRAEGKLEEAVAAYRKAIEIAPSYHDPLNGLGALKVGRDRLGKALPLLERAIAIAPDFHEARLNRAIALQLLGCRDEALAEYDQQSVATA